MGVVAQEDARRRQEWLGGFDFEHFVFVTMVTVVQEEIHTLRTGLAELCEQGLTNVPPHETHERK